MNEVVPDDLIGVTRAAQEAGVGRKTIYRWIEAGKLPAWDRTGRLFVSRADLACLYRRHAVASRVVTPPSARALALRDEHAARVLRAAGFEGY